MQKIIYLFSSTLSNISVPVCALDHTLVGHNSFTASLRRPRDQKIRSTALTPPNRRGARRRRNTGGSPSMRYAQSRNSIWKWIFRLSALPKRWISVTTPVLAVMRVQHTCSIRRASMARQTMPYPWLIISACVCCKPSIPRPIFSCTNGKSFARHGTFYVVSTAADQSRTNRACEGSPPRLHVALREPSSRISKVATAPRLPTRTVSTPFTISARSVTDPLEKLPRG